MSLETATYIEDLVATNPVGATDFVNQGDDHLRLLKAVLKAQFPSLGQAAVSLTAAQLNDAALKSATQTISGAWTFSNPPTMGGGNITGINASNISSGTLADGRLSSNVPLKNAANIFTAATQTISAVGANLAVTDGTVTGRFIADGANGMFLQTTSAHPLNFFTNGSTRGAISAAGNWTINAPTSGVPLTLTTAGAAGITLNGSSAAAGYMNFIDGNSGTRSYALGSGVVGTGYFALYDNTAAALRWYTPPTGGLVINAPSSGSALSVDGRVDGKDGLELGFREVPQNAQTGNYTCVLADSGKHIYHAAGAGAGDTYTIPANASVAYPIGTVLTFANMSADAVSIAITSDTLYWAGIGTTGTRTLAQYGMATAVKLTATTWLISGTGLS